MGIQEILSLSGKFCWSFGQSFFIETEKGNFIWNDPDYGGDNHIYSFKGEYGDWLDHENIRFGRSKGQHFISSYCGEDLILDSEIDPKK